MIERAVCANANDVKGKRTPIVEYVNVYTIHLEHGEAVVSPIALEYQRQVQVLAAKATCYQGESSQSQTINVFPKVESIARPPSI